MVNFTDRVPENPNQYILTTGGQAQTVTIVRDDNPVNAGTPLDRETFMGVQGFISGTTVFNSSGSITETNETGTLTTTFLSNGSIQEAFVGTDGSTVTKTTTFLSNGNIQEVLS